MNIAQLLAAVDPRSMILLAGVLNLVMVLTLVSLRRGTPSGLPGIWCWTLAALASVTSTVLFGLRGVLPDILSITIGNMVLFVSFLLYWAGSRRFLGVGNGSGSGSGNGNGMPTGWWAMTAALGAWMYWYSAVNPSYGMRLGFFSLVTAIIFYAHFRLYLTFGQWTFGRRFMATVMLLQSVMGMVRLVTVLGGQAGTGLLEVSVVQTIYVGMFSIAALLLAIAIIVMVTERVREEFEVIASHDSLTGILNRGAWMKAYEARFHHAMRHHERLAVLMLDADHFKAVNDSHGHQAGDAMLRELGVRLGQPLRASDLLGRYGGEEFALALPLAGEAEALAIADRLRAAIAMPYEASNPLAERGVAPCTASIGLAIIRDSIGETPASLLARADAALYRAKQLGRDRVETDE